MLIGNTEILLIGVPFLKSTTYINKNIDDKTIQGAIKTAQDVWLNEIIGNKLLTALCVKVKDHNLTGKYRYLVEHYVRTYLQYRTMAELQIPITAKLREQGVITTQGTEYQPLSKSDIDYNRQYYINLASQVRTEMIKWLDDVMLPEWTATAVRDAKRFTTNITL